MKHNTILVLFSVFSNKVLQSRAYRQAEITIRTLFLFMIAVILISCNNRPQEIKQALKLAGENAAELEKVLDYYSHSIDDSLKKKAAEFLIINMTGHYSFREGTFSAFTEAAIPICTMNIDVHAKKQLIDSLVLSYDIKSINPEPDNQIISADYLIHNIDFSFSLWNKPWASHLTFDQFCEYLLPYKYAEFQQLDYWKDSLYNREAIYLQKKLFGGIDENYSFYVANLINERLRSTLHPYYLPYEYSYLFFNESLLEHIPFGACTDYSNIELAIFRANGVPAVSEMFPNRGRNREGHGWISILNSNGAVIPIPDGFYPSIGALFNPTEDFPKAYRLTYGRNDEYANVVPHAAYKDILSPFLVDITDRYIATSNLTIPITSSNIKDKCVFIAVFDNKRWKVVDKGMIKNKEAYFDNIGRNIAYLVLGNDGRKLVPISSPFLLKSNGNIEYIQADTSHLESVTLYRKYPASNHVLDAESRLIGGKIEASNRKDFSNSTVLFSINDSLYSDLITIDAISKYRYWRYTAPAGSYGCIAELQFYKPGEDSIAKGSIIANTFETWGDNPNNTVDKVFDGDHLTMFDSKNPNQNWVGLDFGKPISIDRIRIIPRSDGNRVQVGDTYELVYWGDHDWVSLGTQVATSNLLSFYSVPKGALLLLHNHTRGQQERIFLYKDGAIEWW
ncbi:discoidin domain-containing protein [Parabacteroides pacaensis]|uniref:discoidin domain-containing protein n=1 Tax=Parabacteroides pacaensis TaxID=2086575 RepID=UPI000D0FF146|nr:discoidin domain-containing protein [Parabacteroides pacaensis]